MEQLDTKLVLVTGTSITAARFLASDESSYLTGSEVAVGGGTVCGCSDLKSTA